MKKKTIFIILGIVLVLVAAGITTFVVIKNNNAKEKAAFDNAIKIFEKYKKISEKVNGIINEGINSVASAITKEVGEDKSKINELVNKKEELAKYLISIDNKKYNNTKDVNKAIDNLKKVLVNVDSKLIDIKEEDIEKLVIDEKSKVSSIKKEMAKLTKEVNDQAKDYSEKSKYVGTYKNKDGLTMKVYLDKDGVLKLKTQYKFTETLKLDKKNYTTKKKGDLAWYYIYNVGEKITGVKSNTSKIRIMYYDLSVSDYNLYTKQ